MSSMPFKPWAAGSLAVLALAWAGHAAAAPTLKANAQCKNTYDNAVASSGFALAHCVEAPSPDEYADVIVGSMADSAATSRAELGTLKLQARTTQHTLAIGGETLVQGRAMASFDDLLTITPADPALLGSFGVATATFHVDGNGPAGSRLDLTTTARLGGAFNGFAPVDGTPVWALELGAGDVPGCSHPGLCGAGLGVDTDAVLSFSFVYGQALRFGVQLTLTSGDPGLADFSHTFKLTGLSTADFFGHPVPGARFIGSGGDDYGALASSVPEPASLALFGAGLALLCAARRRAGPERA